MYNGCEIKITPRPSRCRTPEGDYTSSLHTKNSKNVIFEKGMNVQNNVHHLCDYCFATPMRQLFSKNLFFFVLLYKKNIQFEVLLGIFHKIEISGLTRKILIVYHLCIQNKGV